MTEKQREGILVKPHNRLSEKEIQDIDSASRQMLEDPGLICYNAEAAKLYKEAGCKVTEEGDHSRVSIPSSVVDKAVKSAPSKITLGARNPDNKLILDAAEPRVRFGSGSETNFWLEVDFDEKGNPSFRRENGSIAHLRNAAHLAENFEHLDFFIRCVNIRDKEVNARNKDVNKFLASLDNMTKHVQAGLTSLDALDEVMDMASIIAGGHDALMANPVISFIACVVKSPLQIVEDTADKVIAIARKRMPLVISSCPMGGATGPFDEFGMVALINAELLAGVTLNQLAEPGAPVLYGAVPVRTRLDNLYDMYGAPEFTHYNMDCAQMARHYGLPCYSTAGVGDTTEPGIQATVEKLMTIFSVPRAGAQYIHYAFGLLDRTNVFCPVQAVMDNEHIGIAKYMMQEPEFSDDQVKDTVDMVRRVMGTEQKVFIEDMPMPRFEPVYVRYALEHDQGGALRAANDKYNEILAKPHDHMSAEMREELQAKVPGILPATFA